MPGQPFTGTIPERAAVRIMTGAPLPPGCDTVVLGCTHYPPLRPLIGELLPEGVQIVDPADAIATRIRDELAHGTFDEDGGSGTLHVNLTDGSQSAAMLGPILLGESISVEGAISCD